MPGALVLKGCVVGMQRNIREGELSGLAEMVGMTGMDLGIWVPLDKMNGEKFVRRPAPVA